MAKFRDHSQDCEFQQGYGEDQQVCHKPHTHLLISHEYPTPNTVKSCWDHVVIQAKDMGWSTYTVVDVGYHRAEQDEAKADAESRAEDEAREVDPF